MVRRLRSAKLETRTARLKLAIRKKPYTARVGPGVRLAYRRNESAGSWSVIAADGKGGNWMKGFATADDHEEANGTDVLDFWQATERARIIARSNKDPDADGGKPTTVGGALDSYEADLKARDSDTYNARRVRVHLPDTFANETVALLTSPRKFRHWRDGLTKKGLRASSVNRTCAAFQAALEYAAKMDPRITNQNAWRTGLAALPDAEQSRNVVIPDDAVLRIISAAYKESPQFGLFVEVAATSGARVSQLARLEVGDVQGDRADPRLMMPSARKGKGRKRIERRPVPIPANLATTLKQASVGKADEAPLLTRPDGAPWRHSDHRHPFARAVIRAGLDPAAVTAYALRHSSVVRQLLANVPIRVVAVQHDTSVVMVERTYSKFITDHADALSRRALLNTTRPVSEKVVVLKKRGNRTRRTSQAAVRSQSIKGPAHSARHRIPKERKSAELLILVHNDAPYYQSIVKLKDRKTDSNWHWHEDGEAIWVPRNWIEDDAIEYARGWLAVEIFSWAEQGGIKILGLKRSKREDEFRAAIAALKCIRENLTADNLPFIEGVLDRTIPALERANKANQRGGHTDLHLPRYRLIAQTVDIICRRYEYRPSRAFSIVAEALRREKAIPNSKETVKRIWRNRRKTFENQVN